MKPHRKHALLVRRFIFGLSLFLAIPYSVSLAQAVTPITPSGLNTTVSAPITLPSGETQFDITGGTRPGGGANLFHSFGNFDVPNNNIANFLNDSGLATSNILGRVTGGNVSDIFGTIQTTGFGNANLFLVNPAGFLFGPNATVNVGGMVTFTSADYLRLADNARFNAVPHTGPDLLLSAAPVAAFGFLGSNPGAITVQGSQLSVAEGTGISLVGGNITVQAGTLSAPSGQINLVSVGKPSHSKVGGEVANGGEFVPTGFKSLGSITLTQGSTVDTSADFTNINSPVAAGPISIRAGQFVMDASTMTATSRELSPGATVSHTGGAIDIEGQLVTLNNQSSITTEVHHIPETSGALSNGPCPPCELITANAGDVSVKVNSLTINGSTISTSASLDAHPGALTIQGLGGNGSEARAVHLTNASLTADGFTFTHQGAVPGGPIDIHARDINLNHATISSRSSDGGLITLMSTRSIEAENSLISSSSDEGPGGHISLEAGKSINLTDTIISSSTSSNNGGIVDLIALTINLVGSRLTVDSSLFDAGTISLNAKSRLMISGLGSGLFADAGFSFPGFAGGQHGGSIAINAGQVQLKDGATLSAAGSGTADGGTIEIHANKVGLTETQITTSVSGGPQTVGGSISMDANKVTLDNSQVLSTAIEGHGGTIDIKSHNRHPVINSVIDATSQFGTDGTVTIH